MQKKWVWPFLALIAVFSVISLYSNTTEQQNQQPNYTPLAHSNQETSEESKQKLAILNEDMATSAALVVSEIINDADKLTHHYDYKSAKQVMEHFTADHPNLVYIAWHRNRYNVQIGSAPKISSVEGMKELQKINDMELVNTHYVSPILEADNLAQYQIVKTQKAGITTLFYIRQTISVLVEQHQKNNLRLIPYPPDAYNSEYETVRANSTEPMRVILAEDGENASHYYDNEVVVKFINTPNANDLNVIKKNIDGELVFQLNSVYVFKSQSLKTTKLIDYFKANSNVVYTEPHYIYITNTILNSLSNKTISSTSTSSNGISPNDALFSDYQWNLAQIDAPYGWTYSQGSDAVTIAVLDTGVNFNHPDLQAHILEGINTTNSSSSANDDVGHGTHVTGIIGAQTNNNEGIAGISWYNQLLPVKVLNGSGYGSSYAVAQGIIWATDQGAKVINMSLGNYASADFLHEAIKYAYEKDVVLIAATGNDNTNRPGYPAAYPEVLAVGATNAMRERAVFSNYGDYIDVVAPGDQIPSTYLGGQYASLSGTSMATPHVAALAGLIRSINPSLTNVQVIDIIKQSARDLGDSGFDIYFGYGEVNVANALAMAAAYNGTIQTFTEDTKEKINQIIEQK